MRVRLLGPPGLLVDGLAMPLSGRQPVLVALLGLHAPRAVSRESLVQAVWPGTAPADPANALHQRVSALRRTLRQVAGEAALTTGPDGYALTTVRPQDVDARDLEARVALASRARRDGDVVGATAVLVEALRLWGGDPLEGFNDEAWARGFVARLREVRLTAWEELAEARLQAGAGPENVPDLRELLTENPLRERLAELLVRSLYRAGRQAEALGVVQQTRERLADELGVDPGPGLIAAYEAVLHQTDAVPAPGHPAGEVVAGAGAGPAPPAAVAGDPFGAAVTRLPEPPPLVGPTIGRDDELAALLTAIGEHHLVTVTGPAGCGKSRLAAQLCGRLPDDVAWVDLHRSVPGAAVLGTLAEALGIGGGGPAGSPVDADGLAHLLAARETVVVLDGCEHVRDDVARICHAIARRCPSVRVIATSRSALGVPGEVRRPLAGLAVPPEGVDRVADVVSAPAVRLLLERARARDPEFTITTGTAWAAAAVTRRVDGSPLALELAAARLDVLSLPELLAGLDEQLALLVDRSPVAEPRHASLRAALGWSWSLLPDEVRSAWAVLCVPTGPFDGPLARRLLRAAAVADPQDAVSHLVDASVLSASTSGTRATYRMSGSGREYGRSRLSELASVEDVLEEHAAWVEEELRSAQGRGRPEAFEVDLERLGTLLPDAREVMVRAKRAGDLRRVARVAGALGWLWLLRGMAAEGLAWLAEVPTSVAGAEPSAVLWSVCLRASGVGGDEPTAPPLPALPVVELAVSDRVLLECFGAVASLHAGHGDATSALLDRAVVTAGRCGGWPLAVALVVRAQLARLSGTDGWVDDAERSFRLAGASGVTWVEALAADLLAEALLDRGMPDRAAEVASSGLEVCRAGRLPELEGRLLVHLAAVAQSHGDDEGARRHLGRALTLTRSTGSPVALGYVYLAAAMLARFSGVSAEAAEHAREALALFGDAPAGVHGAGLARDILTDGAGGVSRPSVTTTVPSSSVPADP